MATVPYRWSRKDARSIMASRGVQSQLKQAAEAGKRGVQRAARRRQRSGDFARHVRVVPARGWDGRPGYRVEAYATRGKDPNAPVSIEFGTRRSRGIHALQEGIKAVRRGR